MILMLKVGKSQKQFFICFQISKKKMNEKVCLILPYESKMGQIDKIKARYYIN